MAGLLCLWRRNSPVSSSPALLFLQRSSGLLLSCLACPSYCCLVYHCSDEISGKNKLRRAKICFGSGLRDFSHWLAGSGLFRRLARQKHCRGRVRQKLFMPWPPGSRGSEGAKIRYVFHNSSDLFLPNRLNIPIMMLLTQQVANPLIVSKNPHDPITFQEGNLMTVDLVFNLWGDQQDTLYPNRNHHIS